MGVEDIAAAGGVLWLCRGGSVMCVEGGKVHRSPQMVGTRIFFGLKHVKAPAKPVRLAFTNKNRNTITQKVGGVGRPPKSILDQGIKGYLMLQYETILRF